MVAALFGQPACLRLKLGEVDACAVGVVNERLEGGAFPVELEVFSSPSISVRSSAYVLASEWTRPARLRMIRGEERPLTVAGTPERA